MNESKNNFELSGYTKNLTKKETSAGTLWQFSLCRTKKVKGEKQYIYFDCKAWKDFVSFSNGDYVTISGYLDIEQWQAQDGAKRQKVVLVVSNPKDSNGSEQSEDIF